jgi:hypothetical protein
MLNGISHRIAPLLAVAATSALTWAGKAPALATSCTPGATDKPDLGFVDSNCDGIDGDKAIAIFVAPGGADGNDGSYGHPKASMQAAIDAAMAAHKDVYAAGGLYTGKIAFLYNNANIGLYGGYDAQTWQRSAANVTTIEAPGQVVGAAIPGVLLQLLTLHSTSGGVTSTGVRTWGQGSVALSRVTIQTANGANGADGAPTPPSPATAPDGAPGYWSSGGCPSHGAQGGRADDVNWGGEGGAAWDFDFVIKGHNGMDDGSANPTVTGGIGGQDAGQKGGQGSNGTSGNPGLGGSIALNRVALFYQAMPGTDGTGGTRGAGGGGGASANEPCVMGAGGGAGGRPGAGGKAGQGGGGSIGVFAGTGAHALVLDGSVIHTANGGKGGNGSGGQWGGLGGNGGPKGEHWYGNTYYASGAGGNGGSGGNGGPGGSGAGGASIGVLAIDAHAVIAEDTEITHGSGGAGGVIGNSGKTGVAMVSAEVTTAGGGIPPVGDFDGDGVSDDADGCPIATGTNNGCPVDPPAGPVAGDPSATAPATAPTGSGSSSGTDPVAVAVLPASSCMAKQVFKIRINARKAHIKTARLTLDGHRLKLIKGKTRWTAKVDLRHSTRTRHTLTIRGTLRSGKRFKQTRHYRTC